MNVIAATNQQRITASVFRVSVGCVNGVLISNGDNFRRRLQMFTTGNLHINHRFPRTVTIVATLI